MSKYALAIKTLSEKASEVGAELYTLELVKRDKNGEAMAALFGGFMSEENTQENFDNLLEAIKLLQEAEE